MRRFRFLQLDVFTETALCGNPLAVFPEAEGLSTEQMQRVAREMNLSDTTFVVAARDPQALRRLRIFTPVSELPMAGHPVAGSWFALAHEGVVPPPAGGSGRVALKHELGIGVLPVEVEFASGRPVRVTMTQGPLELGEAMEPKRAEQVLPPALGLSPDELNLDLPVQTASTGARMLFVPVRSLDALGRCRVDSARLTELSAECNALGAYVFTLETRDGGRSAAHARLFAPGQGIAEDPVTGSASGALGGYLVHHAALAAGQTSEPAEFVIEQGDFMERPGRVLLEVLGRAGAVQRVRVGGPSVIVVEGTLLLD